MPYVSTLCIARYPSVARVWLCSDFRPSACMQDTFARARTQPKGCTKPSARDARVSCEAAARPSARATIGYLVYKPSARSSNGILHTI